MSSFAATETMPAVVTNRFFTVMEIMRDTDRRALVRSLLTNFKYYDSSPLEIEKSDKNCLAGILVFVFLVKACSLFTIPFNINFLILDSVLATDQRC